MARYCYRLHETWRTSKAGTREGSGEDSGFVWGVNFGFELEGREAVEEVEDSDVEDDEEDEDSD